MTRLLVLDSFALLAVARDEPGASAVEDLVNQAQAGQVELQMSVINLGEVFYKTVREKGLQRGHEVLKYVQQLPIEFQAVDRKLALAAAEIKGLHRISYADCIAAALAQRLDATLVTGDDGFRQIANLRIEWLPK